MLETRDCPTVLPPGGPEPPPPGPGFPPQANPDHFTFAADTPIRISITDLLANDTAAPGLPLTVELLGSPADGQLDLIDVGLWEYTPGTGFSGSDAFSYRLFNGTDYSLSALVTFEQQPAAPSTPTTLTVIDVTETWLTGFEDEALGSVTVAVFETAEADVLDWTASIDWGDGSTTAGQIVADGDGRYRVVGQHTYDDWGLYLVQVTLTDAAEATHDLYNLASIQFRNYTYTFTDPIGNSTQFVFAEGWRLTQEIDPLGNSTFYSYTSDGLLASRTDRLGRAITFDYGPDGVLVGQTWLAADLTTVVDTLSFSYTSDGLLLSASNGVGAYTFSWADGVLTGVTNPFGVTLTFGYDTDGRRTSVADSFGGLITSTYTDGLLASRTLTAGALNLRVDLGYDADGVPTQISRFAGPLQELVSQTEYAFAQELLASITHRGAGGVILDQFLYQFDEDGFLSQITSDFAGETDYSYDSDGQLTGESSLLVTNTFSYDANGNRVGGGYVVGPGNRLLADGTWSYSYDAEGNLIGKTHLVTGDSWTYSYDHRNQMTLAEKRDATGAVVLLAVYQYDVFGNRIEKAVDWDGDGPNAAVVTRYVLDGWNNSKPTPIGNEHFDVYAELDGTNQLIARYLHGDEFDQTFARVLVDGSMLEAHWLLTDHLNSVRLVLDESGALLDQIAYDAFGNIVAQLNPLLANPILFASREFDAETGLYYNRARYLDPTTGRWTTQDPLGFAAGDANLYRYVGNTPTMLVDPSGLAEDDPLTQGPYGVVGRIALWWFSNGDEHKPIPRSFDPTRTMPGLRMGDSIGRENKLWYDQALNTAPKVMIVTGFVVLGMVIPGPEDAFIAWAAGRGITVAKNGGAFVFKRGTQELAENEVKALIGAYQSVTSPRAVYKSISDALGDRLTGFVARQNGLTKHPVKNTELLKKLREIEPGNWQKVYKDGTLDGSNVSIHYFQSPSGKVFDVQIKPGWSN